MKGFIVAAVILLFAVGAKAQDTGTWAPKELTCTEKAFNFSFSIGDKWKLSAPKMGPLEAASFETDYLPAWALKANVAANAKPAAPLYQIRDNKPADKYKILFPTNNFSPVGGYAPITQPAFSSYK